MATRASPVDGCGVGNKSGDGYGGAMDTWQASNVAYHNTSSKGLEGELRVTFIQEFDNLAANLDLAPFFEPVPSEIH